MTAIARDLSTEDVRKAYGRWAAVYDALCGPIFAPAHRAAAEAANRIGGDILEVGVGTGLVLPLYRPDARVTGVDLARGMLIRSADRVARLGLQHVKRLELADIATLGHPSGQYDAIVLPFVLTLLQSPEAALDNCLRMLKPGGEIVVVSHFLSRRPWLARLERRLARRVAGLGLRPDFPLSRIEAWAGQAGMALVARPVGPFGAYTLVRISRR